MTKEKLAELGLTEEQTAAVLEAMKGFVPKYRFDELNENYRQANETVKERDKQLESLKASADNAEDLKATIAELQKSNKAQADDFEKKFIDIAIDSAMDRALLTAKARNLTAAKAMIKRDALELKDGEVLGLDKQIEALVKDDATKFLFETEAPVVGGFKPLESGTPTKTDDFTIGFKQG
ncbi:MAG: phage scaffolding protein [Abditibacteriota bacterium]|nr:phage scaffolding protein [Abditibacteriota bacterium]